MKILFLAPQPFFRVRGTPINVRNVIGVLGEAGHSVDLLCYPWGEDVDLKGVRILRSPAVPGLREVGVGISASKFILDFLMFFRAWALCWRNRYDVIHAVEESAFFGMWLAKLFRARLVYDVDSCISDQLRDSRLGLFRSLSTLAESFERAAIRRAAFVLTVCRSLTDWVRSLVPEAKVVQIEDAPLQASFQQDEAGAERLRKDWALDGFPVVVYTGNMAPYQGVDLLIRAFSIVRRRMADVRCVVVGGEEDEIARLRENARSLDLSDSLIFTGKRPMEEMPAYMTLATVLVSPRTKGVNTALKIYTYMQSGKPIVATRLATHTQVLDESCAVLVQPQPDDLAEGILQVLREPLIAAALGREAKARVAAQYSLASFRHKVRTAYSEMIGK